MIDTSSTEQIIRLLGAGFGVGIVLGSLVLVADRVYSRAMDRYDAERPDRDAEIGGTR